MFIDLKLPYRTPKRGAAIRETFIADVLIEVAEVADAPVAVRHGAIELKMVDGRPFQRYDQAGDGEWLRALASRTTDARTDVFRRWFGHRARPEAGARSAARDEMVAAAHDRASRIALIDGWVWVEVWAPRLVVREVQDGQYLTLACSVDTTVNSAIYDPRETRETFGLDEAWAIKALYAHRHPTRQVAVVLPDFEVFHPEVLGPTWLARPLFAAAEQIKAIVERRIAKKGSAALHAYVRLVEATDLVAVTECLREAATILDVAKRDERDVLDKVAKVLAEAEALDAYLAANSEDDYVLALANAA